MRTELDETDRRLMAIDHHINTQNDELAREIEALRAGGEVMDPLTIGVLSTSIIVGLGGASLAGLKAWNGWLELKKMRADPGRRRPRTFRQPPGGSRSPTCAERVRKLEAIAAGIDL